MRERRKFERFPACTQATVVVETSPEETRLAGRMLNVSIGGALVWLPVPLEVGQVLRVEPSVDSDSAQQKTVLHCTAVRSDRADVGGFLVGCAFRTRLDSSVLQQLQQRVARTA